MRVGRPPVPLVGFFVKIAMPGVEDQEVVLFFNHSVEFFERLHDLIARRILEDSDILAVEGVLGI